MHSKKLSDIFEKNTYMAAIYPGDTRSALEVFCLYEAQGEYFDISDPANVLRDSFVLGPGERKACGYIVGKSCIGCKLCYSKCPQYCIDVSARPAVILQSGCLRCGICYEICPARAIMRCDRKSKFVPLISKREGYS